MTHPQPACKEYDATSRRLGTLSDYADLFCELKRTGEFGNKTVVYVKVSPACYVLATKFLLEGNYTVKFGRYSLQLDC